MRFEWDDEKAESNIRKHGVSFIAATKAFDDPHAVELLDEMNSDEEIRFQIIGLADRTLLFVSFTERDGVTRIISARKANARQTRIYHERKG